MKTRKQCFEEARQLFIDSNPDLLRRIEEDAAMHSDALGISQQQFVHEEINVAFGRYFRSLGSNGDIKIIEMTCQDEANRKALVLECHYEMADALCIPRDEYLRVNGIQI